MTSHGARRKLADRLGILPGFTDTADVYHETSEDTRTRLLYALGYDAETEEAARQHLQRLDAEAAARVLDPVAVVSALDPDASRIAFGAGTGGVEYAVTITSEDGTTRTVEGTGGACELPELRPGYHRIDLDGWGRGHALRAEQIRIVHPGACYRVEQVIGERRRFGVWANLYAVRSARNWGVGDLADLETLVRWAGAEEAAYVGINPLHALHNTPPDVSPYYPVSRIFVNPLYLDVEALAEWRDCDEARALCASDPIRRTLEALRRAAMIDYRTVWELKCRVLTLLHATFERVHLGPGTERGQRYRQFRDRYGTLLTGWCAWMEAHHPGTSAAFHAYLQFAMDEQLAGVAAVARAAGLELGVYADLAVGAARGSADVEAFPDVFVRGATIGAPPDAYAREGQDWSVHPLHPWVQRDSGYRYWRAMLATAMRHAGALRIDHVMGLERQFWIPDGRPAREGAYVRYPAAELFGVLALESGRHRAVVVGESLGTLPDGFVERLREWGILSSQVLYFERDEDGGFRGSAEYSPDAMVTANTHDLATWRGFWSGADLEQRRSAGLLSDEELVPQQAARERDRNRLDALLAGEGMASPGVDASAAVWCPPLHEFLARTPCALLGVALDDLGGETTGVNVPGAPLDRHTPWTRRQELSLEEIEGGDLAVRTLEAVRRAGRGRAGAVP